MSDEEVFRKVRACFGTMDDLCQQRRRIYTEWVGGRTPAEEFVAVLKRNLAATRSASRELEAALGIEPGESGD